MSRNSQKTRREETSEFLLLSLSMKVPFPTNANGAVVPVNEGVFSDRDKGTFISFLFLISCFNDAIELVLVS